MLEKNPKAYTAQRIVLNFVEGEKHRIRLLIVKIFDLTFWRGIWFDLPGDEFASRLTSYVKRYLRRGIPSLFTDVKALYVSEDKVGSWRSSAVSFIACERLCA